MLKFAEMDSKVTLIEQMETDVSPVVLINRFTVTPEEVDQLLKAWAADAAFLKTQPGCISAQLHRGIGGSCCL
jgi:Antibiotic biosynthesis monooxygenase